MEPVNKRLKLTVEPHSPAIKLPKPLQSRAEIVTRALYDLTDLPQELIHLVVCCLGYFVFDMRKGECALNKKLKTETIPLSKRETHYLYDHGESLAVTTPESVEIRATTAELPLKTSLRIESSRSLCPFFDIKADKFIGLINVSSDSMDLHTWHETSNTWSRGPCPPFPDKFVGTTNWNSLPLEWKKVDECIAPITARWIWSSPRIGSRVFEEAVTASQDFALRLLDSEGKNAVWSTQLGVQIIRMGYVFDDVLIAHGGWGSDSTTYLIDVDTGQRFEWTLSKPVGSIDWSPRQCENGRLICSSSTNREWMLARLTIDE
jgi:hypothetical protein